MNYFATVHERAGSLVDGICRHRKVTRPVAMHMAAAHLQTMRDEWFSGETPNIAYEDPLCRFAYLYCHTAVNANLCEYCIRQTDSLSDHISRVLDSNGELRICAFGGGPGTASSRTCQTPLQNARERSARGPLIHIARYRRGMVRKLECA